MTELALKRLACELSSLSVFRGILKTETMAALLKFLCSEESLYKRMELFGEFVYSLANDNYSFSDFLCRTVYADENRYIIGAAAESRDADCSFKQCKS